MGLKRSGGILVPVRWRWHGDVERTDTSPRVCASPKAKENDHDDIG
jgi:hypothetical protein